MQNQETWDLFLESFKNSVSELNKIKTLSEYMENKGELTAFYKNELFPKIAEKMGISKNPKEFLLIDIVLSKQNESLAYPVPQVFIESENDAGDELENEVYKLACVNAPLKVLMTRLSLKNAVEFEDGAEKNIWYYVLNSFAFINQLVGYFSVISLEWENDKPKYCYVVYDEKAQRIGEVESFVVE